MCLTYLRTASLMSRVATTPNQDGRKQNRSTLFPINLAYFAACYGIGGAQNCAEASRGILDHSHEVCTQKEVGKMSKVLQPKVSSTVDEHYRSVLGIR